LESRQLLAAFAVTNVNDSGPGSLRAAVVAANNNPGKDDITFAIAGSGVHTIVFQSLPPNITDPVTIDGFTQPGSQPNSAGPGQTNNAVHTIVLDGSALLGYNFPSALTITAGNSVVRGLSVQKFRGVGIVFSSLGGNLAVGNLVNNTGGGITVQSGNSNRIGGLNPADQNVGGTIGVSSSNNLIQGNVTNGMGVTGDNNTVGGIVPAARNVASGNIKYGIIVRGANNRLLGNYIGTDVTGLTRLRNGTAGVFITGNGNTIGGTEPGARNIISGNSRGVYIYGGSNNVVQGNWIGLNAAGDPLGNGLEGVQITNNGANNLIGGTATGAGNVIAANRTGVTLFLGATGNVVQGNKIGTRADGVTPAGNIYAGVLISSTAMNNTIGGTSAGAGNLIANTLGNGLLGGGNGVLVEAVSSIPPTAGNAILGNSIFANAALGIDLTPDESTFGVTSNDTGDGDSGGNNLQNFPVLSSAISGGGTTTMGGTLNSRPNTSYRIELFASPNADPSGFGEGARFLGAVAVTTNASGNASFTANLPVAVSGGQVVTATATDPAGNTSEFSRARSVAAAATATRASFRPTATLSFTSVTGTNSIASSTRTSAATLAAVTSSSTTSTSSTDTISSATDASLFDAVFRELGDQMVGLQDWYGLVSGVSQPF
jgi:hypothetical protein